MPSRLSRYDPRNKTRWTPSTVASYAACMACRARRRSAPPWRRLARRPSHFGREAVRCATFTAFTSRPRDDAWLDDSLIVPTRAWAEETTEHILLQCPGYTEQRRRLFDAYGGLGLPHVSLDHLRFPQAHRSRLMRAFEALLKFFGDAALIARL
ncbi:hypothetical protein MRX96_005813 [Rhipicephalus microplus]